MGDRIKRLHKLIDDFGQIRRISEYPEDIASSMLFKCPWRSWFVNCWYSVIIILFGSSKKVSTTCTSSSSQFSSVSLAVRQFFLLNGAAILYF